MKKRMLSLFLALCMVLGMLPVSALAAEIPDGMNIAQISDIESITAGDEITFSLWGMDGYSAPSYIAVVPAGTQSVTVSFQEGTICDPYEDYNTGELKLSGCMVTYDQENDAYVGSGTESSCDNSSGLNTIVLDVEAMIGKMRPAPSPRPAPSAVKPRAMLWATAMKAASALSAAQKPPPLFTAVPGSPTLSATFPKSA